MGATRAQFWELYHPNGNIKLPFLVTENGLYQHLVKLNERLVKRGSLLLADHPDAVKSPIELQTPLSEFHGFADRSVSLYGELVKASQMLLMDSGVKITATELREHRDNLAALYFLESCLMCYQTVVRSKDSVKVSTLWVTKNMKLVKALGVPANRLAKMCEYIKETQLEVATGKFNCMAFRLTEKGFEKPTCRQITVGLKGSSFIPFFAAFRYMEALLAALQKSLMEIEFLDLSDDAACHIKTTLNQNMLKARFSAEALQGVGNRNALSPLTTLCVIDENGSYYDLNIAKISRISVVKSKKGWQRRTNGSQNEE
ncbi:hypothetical protein V6615_05170 [Oscillospiraceae bacterium PP1C4]